MTPDQMLDEQEPTAWSRAMARHERQLVVGARVQVQTGECAIPAPAWMRTGDPAYDFIPLHDPRENGLVGTIKHARRSDGYPDEHRIYLVYDTPLPSSVDGAQPHPGRWFAPAELLVLRAADADEEGDD